MTKVVAVFGLSGVGKSWMISRYAATANVAHVQASQLMRTAKAAQVGMTVTSEDLRRGPVIENQTLLTDAFAKVLAVANKPIIFDGHCLVDVDDHLVEVPTDVVRRLQTAGIILVHASADEIVRRRETDTTRIRPLRTADDLAAQQHRCRSICASYAHKLALELVQVRAGDERAFALAVTQMLND